MAIQRPAAAGRRSLYNIYVRHKILLYAAAIVLVLGLGVLLDTSETDAPAIEGPNTEAVEMEEKIAAQTPEPTSSGTVSIAVTENKNEPDKKLLSGALYRVVKVIDGDTVVIDYGGIDETVRMIGVDTPETVHPSKPVQCFGMEASKKTKEWLEGREVYLVVDASQGERDKYGRLLGYIFRDDGLFINQSLISEGFAYEYTYNLPYKYQSEFQAAEDTARIEKHGLWADEACGELANESSSGASFVPAFNPDDKDCADFTTQAEAQAYFEAGGGSPTYNFDRLDSDHDGEACESLL